jgi:hypothetical protein
MSATGKTQIVAVMIWQQQCRTQWMGSITVKKSKTYENIYWKYFGLVLEFLGAIFWTFFELFFDFFKDFF